MNAVLTKFVALVFVLFVTVACPADSHAQSSDVVRPLVLAHYMPWYQRQPADDVAVPQNAQAKIQWGWHWTMNHFDPNQQVNGRRPIASHYYPSIEPYDSADQDVLASQLMLMKVAGIDGVIVDWYGLSDYRDYGQLHRSTMALVEQVKRLDMRLVICYEDQTVKALVDGKRLPADQMVQHAVKEIDWLAKHWMSQPYYVKHQGKPVLLSFGYAGLSNQQWQQCLDQVSTKLVYLSEHHPRPCASGAYDWPIPDQGVSAAERFSKQSREWSLAMPVVFPRFVDIYAQAKVSPGYAEIPDQQGQTFRQLWKIAMESKPLMVQIATWNDWGEGTQIEPSREFEMRDLKWIQQARHQQGQGSVGQVSDLSLPIRYLAGRRSGAISDAVANLIVDHVAKGDFKQAARHLP
ncbi:MAG: hypothetical protein CBB71_08320 [Rhodopirellula sp. TMED11]|nr:MAG: hypothetical protein CBB71_08320 [Rhodopirellula sp. TMED11]